MTAESKIGPEAVAEFWRAAGPGKWFEKDAEFDRAITERFRDLHAEAATGGKADWAATPEGALALVLVLDQFSRNIHRGTAAAFASDTLALSIADRAIDAGFDRAVPADLVPFFYLPFGHSEQITEQERGVRLFHRLGDENLRYARLHERIIRRFGRFPHRNAILGRHMTLAEQAFLDGGGFAG